MTDTNGSGRQAARRTPVLLLAILGMLAAPARAGSLDDGSLVQWVQGSANRPSSDSVPVITGRPVRQSQDVENEFSWGTPIRADQMEGYKVLGANAGCRYRAKNAASDAVLSFLHDRDWVRRVKGKRVPGDEEHLAIAEGYLSRDRQAMDQLAGGNQTKDGPEDERYDGLIKSIAQRDEDGAFLNFEEKCPFSS